MLNTQADTQAFFAALKVVIEHIKANAGSNHALIDACATIERLAIQPAAAGTGSRVPPAVTPMGNGSGGVGSG